MGVQEKKEGPVEHDFPVSSLERKVDISAIHWDGTKMQCRLSGEIVSSVWDTLSEIWLEMCIRLLTI